MPTTKVKLIPGAFDILVRDQGQRPTCSAFASDIEVMSGDKNNDLSEQYFYWSKPEMPNITLPNRGSWAGYGIEASAKSSQKMFERRLSLFI